MEKSGSKQHGFTLIELMIVVVIIGIFAALAIPRFIAASTRAKQAEAKQVLQQIQVMERAMKQEHGVYYTPTTAGKVPNGEPFRWERLGVQIPEISRYEYRMSGNANTFTATANAPNPGLDDDPTADTWTINDAGTLVCTSDDAIN